MIRCILRGLLRQAKTAVALVPAACLFIGVAMGRPGAVYGQPAPAGVVVAGGDRAAGRIGTFSGRGGTAHWRVVSPEPAAESTQRFYGIRYDQGSGGFCGWYVDCLRRPIDATSLDTLKLWVCGGAGGEKVRVGLKDSGMDPNGEAIFVGLPPLTRQWQSVEVPLSSFRGLDKRRIASVVLMPASPRAGAFYVAAVRLTAAPGSKLPAVVSPGAPEPALGAPQAGPETPESAPEPTPKVSQSAAKVRISSIRASGGIIRGTADNLPGPADQFCVAVFVKSDIYYVHPVLGATASIAPDGSWHIRHSRRGGERAVAAVLMRRPFDPPDQVTSLEALRPLAKATIPYQPEYDATPRVLRWAGRSWLVKSGRRRGPGNNDWSDDPQAVWVDDAGLHLTIGKRGSAWQSAEVSSLESLGWGDYEWAVDLPKEIPPEIVFALFVYQDDRHEIEAIEMSQWGDPTNAHNAQYCLQPAAKDSMHRFNVTCRSITVRFSWRPEHARFSCFAGGDTSAPPIAAWAYSGPKLFRPGRERVHMNYWLVAKPPSAQPQGIVVRSFSFKPAADAGTAAPGGR